MSGQLHLAVALDGAGWHPAAWRDPSARPAELFSPEYWLALVREAGRGRLDFVTIEDSLNLGGRADRVQGRLDAVQVAARVAPATAGVGIVPTVTVTTTEPFHVSTQIATLDYLSRGRAGLRAQVAPRPGAEVAELIEEAGDYVEVVRRLWDSWEDDAVIRDAATGRFVDRDKLHYIDFAGRYFSVRGPSITPRPPQGQPVVTALAHAREVYDFAADRADVVFVTSPEVVPADRTVKVLLELVVFLDAGRQERLDELDGAAFTSDADVFVGTPAELAELLLARRAEGVDGFRLRPGVLPADLTAIVDEVLPRLRAAGAFRSEYSAPDLRGHLVLPAAPNRYTSRKAAA